MPPSLEERRPAITPQLALRVALLGGFAFILFGVVFFRLWFLQVLTGEDYVSQARENRVRKVRIEAPRGDIVDRNGRTLVRTRVAPVVQVVPSQLPESVLELADGYRQSRAKVEGERLRAASRLRSLDRELNEDGRRTTRPERRERRRLARAARKAAPVSIPALPDAATDVRALYRRLGRVIDVSPRTIHRRVVEGVAETPYSNVTIKTDVAKAAFNYLRERKERFPGIAVEKLYLRSYPHDELAAQLFGTLREISPKELKERRYRGVASGTRIGASGIEYAYDSYLRGRDGYTKVVINALGNRDERRQTSRVEPKQGNQLKLSLDLDLQRTANNALRRAIAAAAINGAKAGAFVAMDPRNGEVLALGSYPSFDANVFAKPLSQRKYDELNSEARGAPLFNRAIAATYPTGSTFKIVTAMAALEEGLITPSSTIVDSGVFKLGDREFKNAKDAVYGPLQIRRALTVSSDVFFYELGSLANGKGPILQDWARKLGIGRKTGIDIPGEFPGLVPDAEWRNQGYDDYLKCAKKAKVTPGTQAALYACGGIERPWSTGDNVNLAVGQGDLQATPLQLATAYSTVANGGRVVRPHLGQAVGTARAGSCSRSASRRGAASSSPTATSRRSWTACAAPPPRRTAPPPTSSRASRIPSTARPAPPSARRTRTSRGMPPTCRIRRARSWSSRPSSGAVSARRRRHPRRA
jgi:penicillin-binding protein 2